MAKKKLNSDKPSASGSKQPVRNKKSSPVKKARQSSIEIKERNEAQRYLDLAGVIFVVLNAGQKVTLINKKGCTVLGYLEKDIIGKSWFDTFVPAGIRDKVKKTFGRLMSGEIEPVEYFENPVLTKKGDERTIAWHNTVIKDEAGKITGTISSGEDITERKVAEEMLINALEESQQRQSEISAVLEGAHSVLKYHDFKSAAQAIFNSCKNLIGATSGYVALLNKDGTENEVVFLDPGGLPCSVDPRLPMPIRGMRGKVYHDKKALYHNDFTNSEWMKFMPKGHAKLSNVLFAPMIVEGKVAGLLGIANKPEGFQENDIHMATAFAELASIALIQKRAEETIRHSEEYFRLVTENALDIITIIDAKGTILYKSLSVELVLGYKREDLIGRKIYAFVHPDDLPYVTNTFNHLIQNPGSVLFIQLRHRHKDDSWRILEVIGKNLLDNSAVAGIVINSRDITERIRTEDELRRSNTDLQQFAYAASHDLQEPLRVIAGFIKLLEKRYKDKLDTTGQEFIGFTLDGVKRMQVLIKDLLEYSKVGAAGKEFQPTDCSFVITQAISNLRAAIEEQQAIITYDNLPTIMADASQLSRLFQNLIGNAIKFHGRYKPRVHISAGKKANEWIFSIRDNGIGIDSGNIERIFVIFQRLHSREKYSGTGIGLAICKRIVERHGGHIWVESETGKGSTFFFTMPVTT